MYGWYNVWMDWFKLHDDLQNEIHRIEDLMLIYIFLSITLCEGGNSP